MDKPKQSKPQFPNIVVIIKTLTPTQVKTVKRKTKLCRHPLKEQRITYRIFLTTLNSKLHKQSKETAVQIQDMESLISSV